MNSYKTPELLKRKNKLLNNCKSLKISQYLKKNIRRTVNNIFIIYLFLVSYF